MSKQVKIIHYGLGPIGQQIISLMAQKLSIHLIAVIDIDPKITGRSLSEIMPELNRFQDVKILSSTTNENEIITLLNNPEIEVVSVSTVSQFEKIVPLLEKLIIHHKRVVTTCEEMFFPYKTHLLLSQLIDKLCKEHNTAVLATGVNPGFLMDALPLFLTSVCKQITSIKVERHQNAAIRRLPFQKKLGLD